VSKTQAERLEEKLRGKPKAPDLSREEIALLLSHPLLEGDIDEINKGSHLWIVRNRLNFVQPMVGRFDDPGKFIGDAAGLGDFDVVVHENKVFRKYVGKVLTYIMGVRKAKEGGLID
jgi:hypothetical protein